MARPATIADATLAGYHLVFWVAAAVFLASAILAALMFRSGPLPVSPDAQPVTRILSISGQVFSSSPATSASRSSRTKPSPAGSPP
jgi:hypothetical protein